MPLFRHGDLLIASIDALPEGLRPRGGNVLARGELTKHTHRIAEEGAVELYENAEGTLFLRVMRDEATLIHEEHGPIPLTAGAYRVWAQREYTPERIVRISD